MAGREVSHFRILEEIGQGGMGKVYLAQDLRLDRRVALKFLGDRFQQDPLARKRFLREAKSAAGLDHPFICSIFEVGEGEGGPAFISMEYVPGETLEERLKRGLPTLRQALQWALEMSEALQCAHEKSLLHRDLKPANVMITPSSHLKVMDFGLAKRLDPLADEATQGETFSTLTREGATPGTLAFMSPEQLKGGALDTRSDLFAFGIMVYQMLTGFHPFQRPSPMETASAILREEPLPVSKAIEHCPSLLDETVGRMLAKDPDRRFAQAEEISERLKLLLDETARSGAALASAVRRTGLADSDAATQEDFPSGADTLAEPAPMPGRPRRWAVPAAALAVVAVLATVLAAVPATRAALADWLPFLAAPAEHRLAVLPFDNFGAPSEQATLLQGLEGNLARRLAQMPEIRQAVDFVPVGEAAEHAAADPQKVWEELRSDFALTGSLHQTGEHLWLTANLIDTRQETRLHSATLDVADRELAEIEEDFARRVGDLIGQELESRRRSKSDGGAKRTHYELYQAGMGLLERDDRKGNLEKAIEDFQLALERNLEYAPAHAGLADANWRRYRNTQDRMYLEQALSHGERAVELDPHLAVTQISLGLARTAAGDWEQAEKGFEEALQVDPSNAKAFYGYGLLRQAQGRFEEAQAHFEKALELEPENWDALTGLGSLHYAQGRYQEAKSAFLRSIELQPDNHIGYRNLGGMLWLLGDQSGAAANFQKSLEIRPTSSGYSNLGTLQFFRGLYSQAAAAFQKAIEKGANDYLMWANLGDAYRQLPQSRHRAKEAYDIAIRKIQERLEENPQDPTLLSRLAEYLAKSGRPSEALEAAEGVRRMESELDVNLRYRLMLAFELAGERDEALQELKATLRGGYPLREIRNDPELARLREDVRFHRIASTAPLSGKEH